MGIDSYHFLPLCACLSFRAIYQRPLLRLRSFSRSQTPALRSLADSRFIANANEQPSLVRFEKSSLAQLCSNVSDFLALCEDSAQRFEYAARFRILVIKCTALCNTAVQVMSWKYRTQVWHGSAGQASFAVLRAECFSSRSGNLLVEGIDFVPEHLI